MTTGVAAVADDLGTTLRGRVPALRKRSRHAPAPVPEANATEHRCVGVAVAWLGLFLMLLVRSVL
jgi:hypothetical protein